MMQSLPSFPTFELQAALESTHTVRGLQKTYPREGNSLLARGGEKGLKKTNEIHLYGKEISLVSPPDTEGNLRQIYTCFLGAPRSRKGNLRCVKPKFLRVVLQSHP